MIRIMIAAAFAATLLPLAVHAQSFDGRADLAYCSALSDKYARYVGSADTSPRKLVRRFDVEGRVALAKCQEGDTATAIPMLERKLINAKVELPQRG